MTGTTSIDLLRDIFSRNKDEIFLVDVHSGTEFSYGDIERHSLTLASYLATLGITKGDRVAFVLPNSIETALLYFACMQVGAIIVPINQRLQSHEIISIVGDAEAHMLFTVPYRIDADADQYVGTRVITLTPRYTGDTKALQYTGSANIDIWEEVEKNKPIASRSFDTIQDDDMLALIFTSGTTSRPKGVLVEFGKIVQNGKTFSQLFHMPPGVRFLGTFSQGYLGGLYNTLLFQFIAEGSVALDVGFDASVALRFWETVEKYNVTALWPVPSMLSIILLVDRSTQGEAYARKYLKYVFTGTAPLTSVLKHTFEERYGVVLWENFALSETFFIATNTPDLPEQKGVGLVIPGCAVSIVDDEDQVCPPGVSGEIVVRSDYMTRDYFKNPIETAERFRDGRFYTGDVGYIDSDGYLFVTDRKKDMIIRGGINISPKEIEEVVASVAGVTEVAVVGVPHAVTGEEIVAVVVGDAPEAEIRSACEERLAPFKVPSRVVRVGQLPKSVTGKIQKHKVKELVPAL